MNIRDFMVPFLLSGALMLLFRSWWSPNENQRSDFIAPASQAELEPLYTAITFEKESKSHAPTEKNIEIKTEYGEFILSSYGAALQKAVLYQGKDKRAFTVIDQSLSSFPEYAPFLVALDNETPWYYTIDNIFEDANEQRVTFKASSNEASLIKTYRFNKHHHKIDLDLTLIPHHNAQVRARIVFPAPLTDKNQATLDTQAVFRTDTTGSSSSFKKYSLKKLNEQMGFFSPLFFGVESKYFLTSYFRGNTLSVERAYCKVIDNVIYGFIESKPVSKETTFTYSFCMIPKDPAVLYDQIKPLEKTFDYGFFGFFTKLMLTFLRFINQFVHNYGWSIIIITCILKTLLLPLTYNSAEKLRRVKESERRFNHMQQKLQNDPEALMRLREEHVKENLSALLTTQGPLFIQMPFIFGLSGVINNSLELCGAPFMGWMKDISMPDQYYVLPILFGILLFFNLVSARNINFKKFIGFSALTLFLVGWFTHFSVAFLLFLLVNMIFHVGQTFIVERVR